MQKILFIFLVSCGLFACKHSHDHDHTHNHSHNNVKKSIDYPEAIDKVFANHGSLETWSKMKSMSYDIVKEGGNENQMIDLQSRFEKITGPTFQSGWDGENYWTKADTSYKSNPIFYTNLMFYFYAMPFVLADEGVIFSETEPIVFEEKEYPGFRISYKSDIGLSPEDEYFIHYDAETYEMAWLGYTVTYYSGKKSDKVKWIRYDDWKQFNGLKLTNTLTWFKTEDGKLTEPKNKREFVNVKVSEKAFLPSELQMPEGGKVFTEN